MHRVHCTFWDGKELEFTCAPDEDVITAALRQNIILLSYCRKGICATCKARVRDGNFAMSTVTVQALSPAEEEEGLVLLCRTSPQSDLEVEFEYDSDRVTIPEIGRAEVVAVHPISLSGAVYRLVLKGRRVGIFTWNPGQYIAIRRPNSEEWRMFSMANTPNLQNTLEFLIRLIPGGVFSSYVQNEAKPGDVLDIKGPFGAFFYRQSDHPPVFIAGSTGLAPNLAMLRQLGDALSDQRMRLFFGITNTGDLFCAEELHALTQQLPHFACHIACVNADASWQHETGFVTDSFLKQMEGEDFTAYDYYLCGPPPMIEAVALILYEKGVDSYQIFREEFVASGFTDDGSHAA
ncbi:MAG: 2Fe-2S iron-sulfur cluster binding domain-containing protein [Deltaproteobacteria bacterium]|nr:2Fe-2S iron-sulfur cluster binding domain-containing protein [Deltaproteobacteria bacterium]